MTESLDSSLPNEVHIRKQLFANHMVVSDLEISLKDNVLTARELHIIAADYIAKTESEVKENIRSGVVRV